MQKIAFTGNKGSKKYKKRPKIEEKLFNGERRLIVSSTLGNFIEIEDGNLDERTSQGASVRIMEDEEGLRYIIKYAKKESGYTHLIQQMRRMQRLLAAGIDIVPKLLLASAEKNQAYYIMQFVDGVSGYQSFFDQNKEDRVFLSQFKTVIIQLNDRLWSKEIIRHETRHFSERQEYVVDRGIKTSPTIEENLPTKTISLNSESIPILSELLTKIKYSSENLNKMLVTCQIPKYTHGDLHFDNMLVDSNGNITLFDVNGSPERKNSIIEFEIGRLFMSFYREIISSHHYNIRFDKEGLIQANISSKGKDILRKRDLAYDMIFALPEMKVWFKDKHTSKKIAQFMEALHFVTVFASRPENEKFPTYLFGTKLLLDALRQLNLNS